jgi:membrane-associated protease RseP (regulator of RpoE activity)
MLLLILGNWLLVPPTPEINLFEIAPSRLLPNLATFDFKTSIFANLLQSLSQVFLTIGKSDLITNTSPESITALSPLTLAGWTGLALNALQLMPLDLLDGGNMAIAMFGHRQAIQIARISRLVLLAIALVMQPWLRIYSLLLFLLPVPRPLILNESIEIGQRRDLVGMILIAIVLLIILPVPKSFLLATPL